VEQLRHIDLGGILVGLIIIGVGLYYFAEKTLGIDLPALDWDKIWPLFVIAIGVGIVYSNYARKGPGSSDR
jgi:hypothetical protein